MSLYKVHYVMEIGYWDDVLDDEDHPKVLRACAEAKGELFVEAEDELDAETIVREIIRHNKSSMKNPEGLTFDSIKVVDVEEVDLEGCYP